MRKTACCLTVTSCLVLGIVGFGRADRKAEVQAILDKAIEARGGKANLTRYQAATCKLKGTLFNQTEKGIDFTGELAIQAPNQVREVTESKLGGKKIRRVKIVNGDQGWIQTGDSLEAMDPTALTREKELLYGEWLMTLVPLRDREFQLALLGESRQGDRPVTGIKVSRKGHLDVKLFLDKEKGTVLRRELEVAGMKGGILYGDFQEVDGQLRSHKSTLQVNGKPFLVMELSDIKLLEKLDDKEFAKPAGAGVVERPAFQRQEDVIYGRKDGMALTMDVFVPTRNANGAAIIFVVSGGWFSSHDLVTPSLGFFGEYLRRGYTVFAVVHGSQPQFTIPDILADLNRAVRYIRFHAKDYHIDPERIGITGGSSGGHLSLMQAMGGDKGNPKAADPVDRTSSRVQAVACFFPPTDFLNYGAKDKEALGRGILAPYKAPFDFRELDPKTKAFVLITDEDRRREIGKRISPITHVTADSPPTLILHGDADPIVPIQQAQSFVARLEEAGVPAKLVVKPGAGHGWPNWEKDTQALADWFDKYLKPR